MSNYFVTHPNMSVNALVDAPSTEKARTTFLDYLERRNLINRADRHYWRKNMIAERVDPADIDSDVTLVYGYEEGAGTIPPSMGYETSELPIEMESDIQSDDAELDSDVPVTLEPDIPAGPSPVVKALAQQKLSPIAKLSLGRYGQ